MTGNKLKIRIIGGSLGGLFTGIALLRSGHDVHIFEKTGESLKDRGAGIVLQYELLDFFREYHIADISDISVPIYERRFLDRNGNAGYIDHTQQLMTSWGTLYHKLLNAFPQERYHYGHRFISFQQKDNKVTMRFENKPEQVFDLLIGADGINSSVRKQMFPQVVQSYAGYVGWRGIVQESELDPAVLVEFVDRFTFFNFENSHILTYLIPGNNDEVTEGKRRINWVWYWNYKQGKEVDELLTDINGRKRIGFVPEGFVKPEFIARQKEIAKAVMPSVFRSLVEATVNPFIQPIIDLAVDRMVQNRVILIGDSAFTPRPHTAASTAKAVANGVSLNAVLDSYQNLEEALAYWEKDQIRIGLSLKNRGIQLGNQSQFGIASINI